MLKKKSPQTDQRRRLKDYNPTNKRSSVSAVKIDMDIDEHKPKKGFNFFSRKGRQLKDEYQSKISRKKTHRFKFAAIVAVLIVGYFGYKVFAATFSIIDRSGQPGALALQDNIRPDQLKEEGDGRINILLIGVGGEGHAGGDLSDVNQVLSIDPFNEKAAVLGLPRDLYLNIPGYYATRINEAHAFGERDGTGGPELLEKTIEENIGIPIHYYARVDFAGFNKAIDAVDGVEVDIKDDLYDPSFPKPGMNGSEVFRMKAGKQQLDGKTALQVVRCRKGTCGNDFGRAARQQDVLNALKTKALSLGTISNPAKIAGLIEAAGKHVKTNMKLSEIAQLSDLAKKFEEENVKSETFVLSTEPDNYLVGNSVGGASVLTPTAGVGQYKEIRNFVRGTLFRDGFIARENASITVLNGTLTPGLATSVGQKLKSYGYNVKDIGDADKKDQLTTKIYHRGEAKKHEFTTALLQKRMGTKVTTDPIPGSITANTDYIIVIGSDYKL